MFIAQVKSYELPFIEQVKSYFWHKSYELLFIARVARYFLCANYELSLIARVKNYILYMQVTSCYLLNEVFYD